jgi:hypothetical protein
MRELIECERHAVIECYVIYGLLDHCADLIRGIHLFINEDTAALNYHKEFHNKNSQQVSRVFIRKIVLGEHFFKQIFESASDRAAYYDLSGGIQSFLNIGMGAQKLLMKTAWIACDHKSFAFSISFITGRMWVSGLYDKQITFRKVIFFFVNLINAGASFQIEDFTIIMRMIVLHHEGRNTNLLIDKYTVMRTADFHH